MGWITARVEVAAIQWPSNNVPRFMGISQSQRLHIDQPKRQRAVRTEANEGVGTATSAKPFLQRERLRLLP
jgi:hypothetical protein